MNAKELRARLAEIAKRMNELANAESLDEAGQSEFDTLAAEAEERQQQLDRLETARRATEDAANREIRTSPVPYFGEQIPRHNPDGRHTYATGSPTGPTFVDSSGREMRTFRYGEPIAQAAPEGVSIGRCLRAVVTGDFNRLNEAEGRALLGASDTAGGYLLSSGLSDMIIDRARSASVSLRAGTVTMPMDNGEVSIVRVDQDPTGYWRPELVAVTASEPVFGRVTLRARTLACAIPISIEALEDCRNIEMAIEQAVAGALGVMVDKAILVGAGASSEPQGIACTPGINSEGSIGTPSDWSKPHAAIASIMNNNFQGPIETLAWIQAPQTASVFASLVEAGDGAAGNPMKPLPWPAMVQQLMTTSLEADAESKYQNIIGHFPSSILGIRSNLRLEVLPAGQVTDSAGVTTNAVSQLARILRFHLRVDAAVTRPAWFSLMDGITIV